MVEFKKKITQCRECPNCRIVPDPDEKVAIPNWCPLKTN